MRVLCAEVGCVYGGDAEPLLGVRNMAATCLVETEQGLAVPTGLTGRVKSRQQSPEPSGEVGGSRTHTFSLNGMFQSQLESQGSLKVSFVSLNSSLLIYRYFCFPLLNMLSNNITAILSQKNERVSKVGKLK